MLIKASFIESHELIKASVSGHTSSKECASISILLNYTYTKLNNCICSNYSNKLTLFTFKLNRGACEITLSKNIYCILCINELKACFQYLHLNSRKLNLKFHNYIFLFD